MIRRIRQLPSPALVISSIALIVAVGGSTFAVASTFDNQKVTMIAKKVANERITKRAPRLSVSHAGTADSATSATHATSADSATSATHATSADSATSATHANSADTAADASTVGGYAANSLGRIDQTSNQSLFGLSSTATNATVTITAPRTGLVKVEATFTASDVFAGTACTPCVVEARLHDVGTGTDAPVSIGSLGARSYLSMSLQWVFSAAAGPHSYSLTTAQLDTGGPATIYNPILTAQFVPFGETGSS
jgi:hypothetical protein